MGFLAKAVKICTFELYSKYKTSGFRISQSLASTVLPKNSVLKTAKLCFHSSSYTVFLMMISFNISSSSTKAKTSGLEYVAVFKL